MHYIIIGCLLLFAQPVFSQEVKVSMDYGYAVAGMKDAKKIVLYTGVTVSSEFTLSNNFALSGGVGYSLLQHHYTNPGEQVFNQKYFFSIPLSLKKYYPFSRRSSGFLDIGVYAAHYSLDKKETRAGGLIYKEKKNRIGWNGGGSFVAGFKTMITPSLSFDLGLRGQKDIVGSYRSEQDRIMTEKTSLFLSFYRKF